MGNKIDKDIYKHLYLEFSQYCYTNEGIKLLTENKNIILEKHGIIPNIDEYINIAVAYFYNELKPFNKDKTINLTENIFNVIRNCFFENVDITVNFKYKKNTTGSNAVTKLTYPQKLVMIFDINADITTFLSEFKSLFAHELLHFYEDVKRRENNDYGLINSLYRDGYFKNSDWCKDSGNERINTIKQIRYFLTKPELSVYISGMREEMLSKITGNEETAHDFLNIIKTTKMYSMIFICGKKIHSLIHETNEENKAEILTAWNSISMKKIKNYNKLIKILENIYLKRYKQFLTTISKIAFDVVLNT